MGDVAIRMALAATAVVFASSPAFAGGWGHGPSWSQGHKIVRQGAKDFHNGVGAIHLQGPKAPPAGGGGESMAPKEDGSGDCCGGAKALGTAILGPLLMLPPAAGMVTNPIGDPAEMRWEREPMFRGCGMTCANPMDTPAQDLPDPREAVPTAPPPVMVPMLD